MPKTGGRTVGTPNKRTRELEALARKAAESGLTPLQYMLAIMRDEHAELARRDEMAKAAAPYIHPKLSSIELDTGPPPEINVRIDMLAMARQIALALSLGDQRLLGAVAQEED